MKLRLPDYELETKIGEGGTAEVFRARSLDSQQTVAIKLLDKRYCQDLAMRKRLLREAEVIGRLVHPNVVRIFRSGVVEDRIYMVLQFLDRGSLSDYRNLDPRQRLKVMIQVCDGVEFVHANEIVHRDLKPSNIMFGDDGIPRLVDFGISLFMDDRYTRLTHTNMVMGTLSYMSPEQQSDPAKVDKRTDVYSLGAILYEIFTGQKPVGRFLTPTELIRGFDQRLEKIIMRAMAHRLEDRYADVAQLKQGLLGLWLDNLFTTEIQAPKETFDTRIGYWVTKLETGTVSERVQARGQIFDNAMKEDGERLVRICQASGKEIRAALIPVLGKLRDRGAAPFLRSQIGDPMLSKSACAALAEMADAEAVKPLALLVKKHEVFSYNALVPLVQLSRAKHLSLVLPYLKSTSYAERAEALKALELGATKGELKDLKKYLKTENEHDLRGRAYVLVQRLELST